LSYINGALKSVVLRIKVILAGITLRLSTAYTLVKTRAEDLRQLSISLWSAQRSIDKPSGTKPITAYQKWQDIPKRTGLMMQLKLWQKQPIPWLPYRYEYVVGGGFEWGSFAAMVLFVLVIGGWLLSASPMVGNLFGFIIGADPVVSAHAPEPTALPANNNLGMAVRASGAQPENIRKTPTPVLTQEIQPTYTPYPTYTPAVPVGFVPIIDIGAVKYGQAVLPENFEERLINVKLSYYWPPYGGINCDVKDGVPECLHTASGGYFPDGVGNWAACPEDIPFGSVVCFAEYCFECQDRGGAIVWLNENTMWLDTLFPWLPGGYWWGQEVPGKVFIESSD
jgi:hypothetical protein